MHHVRLERSNWNSATNGATSATYYGAPGLRIRGNLQNSRFDIATDANSGPGVDIVRVSGRNIHDLQISGLLSRDGWYDMTNGVSGGTHPQAGLNIVGFSGGSIDFIDLTGLKVVGGKAKDDGSAPSYYHPAVGANFDSTSFVQWPDVQIDSSIATPYTIGAGGLYRSQLSGRAGAGSIHVIPVCTTTTRPGTSGQPVVVQGMCVYDTTLSKPVWFSGSAWKDAAGTTV